MRCFFCAEENKDDALVCRACGNDLRIPEPLLAENRELKRQVQELRAEIERLQAGRTASVMALSSSASESSNS